MTKYLAGVLTVIAMGVLLVAYGLLAPRLSASNPASPQGLASGAMVWVPGSAGTTAASAATVVPLADGRMALVPASVPMNALAQPAALSAAALAQPAVYQEPAGGVPAVRAAAYQSAPSRVSLPQPRRSSTAVRSDRRDWKKTALVVGGAAAGGAGLGALIGGRKGALIGAAVGGGGGTLYETLKK